ncbi:MAG: hypothetical protein ACQ9MH_16800 [Nitrospinales bacterium]
MAENGKSSDGGARSILAYLILGFSILAITVLAIYVIRKNPGEGKSIFNIVLPVFASWVGTILAFYFGRDNFESANKQVREIIRRLTPEERAKTMVNSIMRSLDNMVHFQIPSGKSDQDVKVSELSNKFVNNVSRLPIVDAEKRPKYMIHDSSIDKYIAAGGKQDDTLELFIVTQKDAGFEYGINKGFVVVSVQSTLADAKRKMEEARPCQDIFITKKGNTDEQLMGWISNVRISKYLEA